MQYELADMSGVLRSMSNIGGSDVQRAGPASGGYVQLCKRLRLGTSQVEYSEAFAMEGFNALFLDCTVFACTGAPDPDLKIYVQVSNDRENWTSMPVGGTPALLNPTVVGYFKLDTTTFGQQISAAYARLRYETNSITTVMLFCAGVERKRIGQ